LMGRFSQAPGTEYGPLKGGQQPSAVLGLSCTQGWGRTETAFLSGAWPNRGPCVGVLVLREARCRRGLSRKVRTGLRRTQKKETDCFLWWVWRRGFPGERDKNSGGQDGCKVIVGTRGA